jgi:hypothetical protein
MMQIPISLWDISLLLAFIVVILLITVEVLIPFYGQTKLMVNQKRLRKITLAIGVVFLISVVITIISNNPIPP